MEKFPNPYNQINGTNAETEKVTDDKFGKENYNNLDTLVAENKPSYFGEELDKASDFLQPEDKKILEKINQLITEDMYELSSEEVAKEYVEKHYNQLSGRGRLFLLEQAINYLADDEFNDDLTDMLLISRSVLNIAGQDTDNFFVNNFAKSFNEEDDFRDNLQNNPREYINDIWSKCVVEQDGETIFRGDFSDVNLSRKVSSVDDLSDDEVAKIVKMINFDHDLYGYNKISNSFEWVEKRKNKKFTNNYTSPSMLSNEDLVTCNLASDVNGVYDSMSGRLVEYLPNKSAYGTEDSEFNLSIFLQDYKHTLHLFDDIVGELEFKGEIKSDIPENIKTILPDVLNDKINLFLQRCRHIREEGVYNTEEYGRTLLQDEDTLRVIREDAQSLKESIKEVLDDFLAENEKIIEPVDIKEIIDDDKTEIEYIHKLFASKRMRQHMEKYFGFRYEELTLATQISFIKFVLDKDNEGVKKVNDFISQTNTEQEKINRFRTFLSLERGDESLGDSIVEFGQNFAEADKIFSYYNELLDSADNAENLVKETVDCNNTECSPLVEQVRENILNRAQKDLEKAVKAKDLEGLQENLETYVVEAKEYVALLQETGINKIDSIKANELSDEDKQSMVELLQKNYELINPGEDQVDFRGAVLSSLENSFNNPNTEFRILRDGDKIVSFNRFDTIADKNGDEITYFGSFNADPAYSGVGGVMLEETIKDRLRDERLMQAHTDPSQPVTKKYINSGFIVTNTDSDYAGTGRMIFEIWQSPEINDVLKTKQLENNDLLNLVGKEDDSIVVREQKDNDEYEEINNGMVLTRYITDKEKTYLVFEKYTPMVGEHDFDTEKRRGEREAA